MKLPLLTNLMFFVMAGNALAGGTVEFEEVEKILRQKPNLAKYVLTSLEFEGSPLAEVRFGPHFTHLSAGRVGPYYLSAKPKGKAGPSTLKVTICTAPTFLDKRGEKAANIFDAVSVREKLTGVIIQDATAEKDQITCIPEY